jgi:hypothetical protein
LIQVIILAKNSLFIALKGKHWNKEEDNVLTKLHAIHGNKWIEISKSIPGRSAEMCRRRILTKKEAEKKKAADKQIVPSAPSTKKAADKQIVPSAPSTKKAAKKQIVPSAPSTKKAADKQIVPSAPSTKKAADKQIVPSAPSTKKAAKKQKVTVTTTPSPGCWACWRCTYWRNPLNTKRCEMCSERRK